MAITLGTNIPSYTARMQLNSVTTGLTNTMEKLSTGLRINKAGDDAAGLVISENMKALISSSKQAQNNIQTATSFLKIAEDGMISISDHFQRINDLLTNMANDTNDVNSRNAAVQEIIERLDEIDRLAESTNFNGRTMLDGSVDKIYVQMGPDETELSVLEISDALTDCHIANFDCILPGNLNPDSLKTADDRIIIPGEDGKYYYEDDGTEYTAGDESTLETGFDPSNENCRAYMAKVQAAIGDIATKRGLLGAYENRMDSSYDSLSTRIESLESAKTVYTDADIAQEATNMVQKQIMQQINVAMVSSANSMQQVALSLLGG